jgi:curved DNA-binding protein
MRHRDTPVRQASPVRRAPLSKVCYPILVLALRGERYWRSIGFRPGRAPQCHGMNVTAAERRKRARSSQCAREPVKIFCFDRPGAHRLVPARLVNISNGGLGLETSEPLAAGSFVTVAGELTSAGARIQIHGRARVAYCTLQDGGGYRLGLSLEAIPSQEAFQSEQKQQAPDQEPPVNVVDYYEVLQVSPNADLETIHRVYRMLAQRHHPDNTDTGNEEVFKLLLKAYRTVSDPEQRAAYDLQHRATRRLRWKIFDQPKAAEGVEGEKRKRRGILSLLYTKRVNQPDQPTVTMMELEELLGCPREHLECSIWYLRETGLMTRSDNGRYAITAKGFEEAEASGAWAGLRENRLLTTTCNPVDKAEEFVEQVLASV